MSQLTNGTKIPVGRYIGYSPQEHQLFEDNISANIARYDEVDQNELKKACDLIGLTEQFENFLKDGELKVSTDGNNLPGGLKQKISLARAFYGSPKLLVLDEPTSMLDSESKELFINAIQNFRKEKSTIIIATHDKTLLKLADYVLGIYSGRQKFLILSRI